MTFSHRDSSEETLSQFFFQSRQIVKGKIKQSVLIYPTSKRLRKPNSWHLHLRKLSICEKVHQLPFLDKRNFTDHAKPTRNQNHGFQFQFWRRRHRPNRRSRHSHPGRAIIKLNSTNTPSSLRTPTRSTPTIRNTSRQTMLQYRSNSFSNGKSSTASPPRTLRHTRATYVRSLCR